MVRSTMECRKCHNDLLVRIEPKGLGNLLRLVPMAPYRCVKCGARHWRASDDWGRTGTRAALMAGVLAAMVWAIWYANRPAGPVTPPAPSNVVREEVVASAAPAPPKAAAAPTGMPTEVPLDEPPGMSPDEPVMLAQAEPTEPVTTESLRKSAQDAEGPGLDEVSVESAPAAPEAKDAEPEPGGLTIPKDRLVGEPAPASAGPGEIKAIDFMAETDRLVVAVSAGRPVEDAKPSNWEKKLIVDLPGKWSYDGPKEIKVGLRGVLRIRTGDDTDRFRIVLDMDHATTTPPSVQSTPGGLIILVQ